MTACVWIYTAQVILPWQELSFPGRERRYQSHGQSTLPMIWVCLYTAWVILPWQREALLVPPSVYFTNELCVSLHCMSYLTMAERGTTSPTVSVLYQWQLVCVFTLHELSFPGRERCYQSHSQNTLPMTACVWIYTAWVILPWLREALPVPQPKYFTNDRLCVALHCMSYPSLAEQVSNWSWIRPSQSQRSHQREPGKEWR